MPTPAKFVASLALAVGIFCAGYMANRRPSPTVSATPARQVLYYTCPMHPQYKSDHPGDAPCCGMRLVPVYADGGTSRPEPAADAHAPGAVQASAAQQQLIGVRTGEVREGPLSHLVRVPGRIAADEGRLHRLNAAVDGWIRELGENSAGTFVRKNEILASYYTTNFIASQQTFLYALQTNNLSPRGDPNAGMQRNAPSLNLQIAADSLRSLGMNDLQLEEIQRERASTNLIHVYSPAAGFVLARNISPGQRFDKGAELYRIADISRVWVMTDIFEKDKEFLRPGATATVRYQDHEFQARMSNVLPQFDPQSRTLKVRFELDNPGYTLRPDMFVDVELHVTVPSTLTVPVDAVIESGRKKTVFIDRGNGSFEPREVETGWRLGDHVQITRGLDAGERIVVSGNFLIDSESRMQFAAAAPAPAAEQAMAGTAKAEKDPVCGMDVDPKAPNVITLKAGGKTYYFCSDHCRRTFQANPGEFMPKEPKSPHASARQTPA